MLNKKHSPPLGAGWLVGWVAGWLVGWLAGLVGWAGWLVAGGWVAGLAGYRREIQFKWFVIIIALYQSKYQHALLYNYNS